MVCFSAPALARIRVGLAALAILAAGPALAQTNCPAIESRLASIEASPFYLNLPGAEHYASRVEQQRRDAESQFIRAGCEAQLSQGRVDATCQAFAQAITRIAADANEVQQAIQDGRSLEAQRLALLVDYDRFGCRTGSGVTFSSPGGPSRELRSLLEPMPQEPEPAFPAGPVMVDVPLPLPRPDFEVLAAQAERMPDPDAPVPELRTYTFEGRTIRIVGPVTPYAPEAAAAP